MPINCLVNRRDKETKRGREEERKGGREEETKRGRDEETKRGRGEMSGNEGEKCFFRKKTEKDLHISKYVRTFAPQLREQPHN